MEMRAEAEAILESCGAVEVPQYSRQELENCLSFYSQRRWINRGTAIYYRSTGV